MRSLSLFIVVAVTSLLLGISNQSVAQALGYVGSQTCEKCHEDIHREWRGTLHSQMVKDVNQDPFAVMGDFEIPSAIRTFGIEDVRYTIGNQWKQRYLTEIKGELYILPAQYNLETGKWISYHPNDWNKRPWLKLCAGCHVTGLDYPNRRFVETGVGCEACHGPGQAHVEEGRKAGYAKTIVNPARLAVGLQVQVCGSCHTRGKDPSGEHGYPANYRPGRSLVTLYKPIDPGSDTKHFWPNGHSKGHHQQYLDWQQSTHAREGVSCISCHTVHSTGSATRFQTRLPGNKLCLECHTLTGNPTNTHRLHDFGSCIGCHMARIVKSAESGDLHDHTFKVIPPSDSLKYGGVKAQPNSCNSCHYHRNVDPADLHKALEK